MRSADTMNASDRQNANPTNHALAPFRSPFHTTVTAISSTLVGMCHRVNRHLARLQASARRRTWIWSSAPFFTASPQHPTSFLRLSRISFEAKDTEGARLVLLREEYNQSTDLGSVTPTLGGETFSYHPLPAKIVSRVSFIYSAGRVTHSLSFEEARTLKSI